MVASIFFILFFSSFFFLTTDASSDGGQCGSVKCGDDGPDIGFPFRVIGQQPQHCGYPGFELSCKQNTTMIHFPTRKDLVVESISYKNRKISLLDPQSCVHEVFLNLNLSLTPFQYYYVVRNYTYLNCSARLPASFVEVKCLSGSRHHVYTVETSMEVPGSCRAVRTVAIPFAYSPYLADNSFGLGLSWNLPEHEDCEARGGCNWFLSKTGLETEQHLNLAEGFSIKSVIRNLYLKVLLCVLAVAALISMQMYHSKKMNKQQIENENLLQVP
ncbi:hypothetical protein Tsubulata_023504 [Turnera subulata]|uniref:RING-type E3 ubiquitin transferase n=1 Tax=Turnera subulata TaxID=218843 RepID=A0A9Q0JNV5_9ROSI|nr:hypothetical protein Tsubulata_023504 [Turnera subulata]